MQEGEMKNYVKMMPKKTVLKSEDICIFAGHCPATPTSPGGCGDIPSQHQVSHLQSLIGILSLATASLATKTVPP